MKNGNIDKYLTLLQSYTRVRGCRNRILCSHMEDGQRVKLDSKEIAFRLLMIRCIFHCSHSESKSFLHYTLHKNLRYLVKILVCKIFLCESFVCVCLIKTFVNTSITFYSIYLLKTTEQCVKLVNKRISE